MEPCPFCEIAAGRTEQEIVFANGELLAFLCEPSATWGHTLIAPRADREDIWAVEPREAAAAMELAQQLAHVMRQELGAAGVNVRQNSERGQATTSSISPSSRATRTTRSFPAASGGRRRGSRMTSLSASG
jgi:histidine triad (HIT) family protein